MTCQYAANCPTPPAPPLTHIPLTSTSLPYTGLSLAFFVSLAVAIIATGLILRYARPGR